MSIGEILNVALAVVTAITATGNGMSARRASDKGDLPLTLVCLWYATFHAALFIFALTRIGA